MPVKTQRWINQQKITVREAKGSPILKSRNPKVLGMGNIHPGLFPDYGYTDEFVKLIGLAYKEFLKLKNKYEYEPAKIVLKQLEKEKFEISKDIENEIKQIKNKIAEEFNNFVNQIPELKTILKILDLIFIRDVKWLFNTEMIVEKITRQFNIYESICNYSNSDNLKYTISRYKDIEDRYNKTKTVIGKLLYKNDFVKLLTNELKNFIDIYKTPLSSFEIITKPYDLNKTQKPFFGIRKDHPHCYFGKEPKTVRNLNCYEVESLKDFLIDQYKKKEHQLKESILDMNGQLEIAKNFKQEIENLLKYPEESLKEIMQIKELYYSIYDYKEQKERAIKMENNTKNNRLRIIRHYIAVKNWFKEIYRGLKDSSNIENISPHLKKERIIKAIKKLLDKNLVSYAAKYIKNWGLHVDQKKFNIEEKIKKNIKELEELGMNIFYNNPNSY
jgi:hypothetical protein